MKKCENCNGTGFEPTENDTIELGATVIEFVDTTDRIEEISNFVGKEIAVDYSGQNPVLKVDDMLIHEHEYIGKMEDTGELFMFLKFCCTLNETLPTGTARLFYEE